MNSVNKLNQARLEQQQNSCATKKFAFPQAHKHLFFTTFGKEYFFFVGEEKAFIVSYFSKKLEVLQTIELPKIKALDIVSTGSGDIVVLTKEGIYHNYIELLLKKTAFRVYLFQEEINPKRVIQTEKGVFIVICEDNQIVFFKKERIFQKCQFPSNMLMNELIMDCSKRNFNEPRLIIPCKNLTYPYVFTVRELDEWENKQYLEKIDQVCRKYYMDDEKFESSYQGLCFSASYLRIYVCFKEQLCVLELKRSGVEEVDFFVQTRMKIKTNWTQLPFFASVNDKIGSVLIVQQERFFEIDPVRYETARWKIKQKDNKKLMIEGYMLQCGHCAFFYNNPEETKMGVMELQ